MGSRSFNIGTLRLLCGLVDMDSVDDMCDEIRMMMVNRGPVSIIGSGGTRVFDRTAFDPTEP
ncbi:hypothetical protein [Fibrobacter sp.]|uniref:hypothetical protein n=1 Tax=Fibrobacter sp. TaxID=35828 RepID=UPI0038902366